MQKVLALTKTGILTHRYTSSFLLSSLIYALLIWTLIYFGMPDKERFTTQTKESAKISVSLVALHAPTPLPQSVQKPTEPKVVEKPIVTPKKTVPREKIVPKEIIQEQTTQEDLQPQEMLPQEAHAIEQNTQQPSLQAAQATQQNEPSLVDTKAIEAKQNLFIEQMREAIDKNKIYPNSARRRAMEGEIKMRFTLQADGSVKDIAMLQGTSMFENSAKEAIEKSFPLYVEKELFSFPKEFQITLVYRLKS